MLLHLLASNKVGVVHMVTPPASPCPGDCAPAPAPAALLLQEQVVVVPAHERRSPYAPTPAPAKAAGRFRTGPAKMKRREWVVSRNKGDWRGVIASARFTPLGALALAGGYSVSECFGTSTRILSRHKSTKINNPTPDFLGEQYMTGGGIEFGAMAGKRPILGCEESPTR